MKPHKEGQIKMNNEKFIFVGFLLASLLGIRFCETCGRNKLTSLQMGGELGVKSYELRVKS